KDYSEDREIGLEFRQFLRRTCLYYAQMSITNVIPDTQSSPSHHENEPIDVEEAMNEDDRGVEEMEEVIPRHNSRPSTLRPSPIRKSSPSKTASKTSNRSRTEGATEKRTEVSSHHRNPQCVQCETRPSTIYGYVSHLSRF
ncbi:hypothetical protein PFISCL1PPCAC_26204, partial [Pristionchus fissidentatus]